MSKVTLPLKEMAEPYYRAIVRGGEKFQTRHRNKTMNDRGTLFSSQVGGQEMAKLERVSKPLVDV